MKKQILLLFLSVIFITTTNASQEYDNLQREVATGWNTWNTYNVLSHVYLPEGLSVNIIFQNGWDRLTEANFFSKATPKENTAIPGKRSLDGSYTSLTLQWKGDSIRVETASDGEQWVAYITPCDGKEISSDLVIQVGTLWNRPAQLNFKDGKIIDNTTATSRTIGLTEAPLSAFRPAPVMQMESAIGKAAGIYAGREMTLSEIKEFVASKRNALEKELATYKRQSDNAEAVMAAIAWNTIYDPNINKVMSPVSRVWNTGWNGWILFDWDTYFAAYMFSLFDKNMAYVNAIEMTNNITEGGFIPNLASATGKSDDRSQPPVGSFVCREIYKKYGEKWFLNEVFDKLLTWNRWWPKARANGDWLSWGSDNVYCSFEANDRHSFKAALFESGLDNSPMYDNVPFNKEKNMLEIADAGLTGMYAWDCFCLAEIAREIGRDKEAKELTERGNRYKKALRKLWDKKSAFFLNRYTDGRDSFSTRISPTNFYPMLADACSKKEARQIVEKHYFNPNEFHGEFVIPSISRNDPAFHDQAYWRGRIWGPQNLLTYLSLKNYGLKEATEDMAQRSGKLLQKSWKAYGSIHENYNGITGIGHDIFSSDSFYHWGALLGFIGLIEDGYMPDPALPLQY
ncbi:MAG: trehalase family glycosidase [Bacteroidales bacterium]|nr:trehalase family glycosidase [Bacteroidales bacterium]